MRIMNHRYTEKRILIKDESKNQALGLIKLIENLRKVKAFVELKMLMIFDNNKYGEPNLNIEENELR
jgi:hypothetical protein